MALKIGNITIEKPIIQGGMGVGISLSNLAAAVANQGGVGVLSPAGIGLLYKNHSKDYLENCIFGLAQEIKKTREKSEGIVGVNIMVALSNYVDLVKTSIKEGADIIFSGAGLPLDLPKYLPKGAKTSLVPIVSSARAAKLLCSKWMNNFDYLPDAIVVEGPKAGGHLGFKANQLEDERFSLETLIQEVKGVANEFSEKFKKHIPVIAAGGVYDKKDMEQMISLGADAVQLGTRFVTTEECDASEEFKKAYIEAKKGDIKIIQSPVGMPGRAINCDFIAEAEAGNKRPKSCPVNCIKTCDPTKSPYCIIASLLSARKGNFNNGYAFAGSNAWRATKIETVKDVFDDLLED